MLENSQRPAGAFATLIAGPTASGKSARAIALAKDVGGIVVNADSMQVYADLRILSARPSVEDEVEAEHALFGFVPSHDEFSVGRYLAAIAPLVANARANGRMLMITGGTGLYFRALTSGLVPTPPVPPAIRDHWRGQAEAGADLHAELSRRDPERAAALHPADTPRLLRAIELHDATGRRYSDWLAENPGQPLLGPGEWQGTFIAPDRTVLNERIDRRFEAMIGAGALDEVRGLLALSPPLSPNLGVMKAHGVPHLVAHIEGRLPLAETIRLGQQDTRAYARRQLIFARKYLTGAGWRWMSAATAE